jgi:hypothetical protein
LILQNKANFVEGEMSVCSLRRRYYENFVPFVAAKNKANSLDLYGVYGVFCKERSGQTFAFRWGF